MKALIEAKADVKVVNTKTKESPLHFAVQYRGKALFKATFCKKMYQKRLLVINQKFERWF